MDAKPAPHGVVVAREFTPLVDGRGIDQSRKPGEEAFLEREEVRLGDGKVALEIGIVLGAAYRIEDLTVEDLTDMGNALVGLARQRIAVGPERGEVRTTARRGVSPVGSS